ncbi:MAG: phosphatidylcholine synthase [Actinomycetaceae bacterium]|nr:phosphatidylcholine synthase [Actinomycetaceae bacterium]
MTTAEATPSQWSTSRYIAVWAVHAFTMSGLLWLILAAEALMRGDIKLMWLWLGVSMVVDAIDGPLARKAKVTEVVPWFSGVMMDNVVDYMTWTLVPALFMMHYLPLGPGYFLPLLAAVMAMVSSMFCYANTKMKSSDWYFVGFPAAWNVVAVTLWLFGTGVVVNWLVVVTFTILAVVPWKWVHPFRVEHLRWANASAAIAWVVATAWWVYAYPGSPTLLVVVWWISGVWLLVASAQRTILGPARALRDRQIARKAAKSSN